jgi:hypothetical protein
MNRLSLSQTLVYFARRRRSIVDLRVSSLVEEPFQKTIGFSIKNVLNASLYERTPISNVRDYWGAGYRHYLIPFIFAASSTLPKDLWRQKMRYLGKMPSLRGHTSVEKFCIWLFLCKKVSSTGTVASPTRNVHQGRVVLEGDTSAEHVCSLNTQVRQQLSRKEYSHEQFGLLRKMLRYSQIKARVRLFRIASWSRGLGQVVCRMRRTLFALSEKDNSMTSQTSRSPITKCWK